MQVSHVRTGMVCQLDGKRVVFYVSWCASALVLLVGASWAWLVWRGGCLDRPRRLSSEEISFQTAREFTHRIVDLVTPALCALMIVSITIATLIFAHVFAIAFNEAYMNTVKTRFNWFVSGARTLIASLTVATGTIGPIPSIVENALDSTCGLESTAPAVMVSVGSVLLQLGCYVEPCLWKDPTRVMTSDGVAMLTDRHSTRSESYTL